MEHINNGDFSKAKESKLYVVKYFIWLFKNLGVKPEYLYSVFKEKVETYEVWMLICNLSERA